MTHEASTTATHEAVSPVFAFAYALILVGSGVLSVAVFLYGLVLKNSVPTGVYVALAGLVGYLAVWSWGLWLAKTS